MSDNDLSTIRVQRHRLCHSGNHSKCIYSNCDKRAALEDKARNTMYARLILDYLRDKNIPWDDLGDDLGPMRETAQWRMPDYLVDEFRPGLTEHIEAKYWAQDIIAGRVVYFPNHTPNNDSENPDNTDYWGA